MITVFVDEKDLEDLDALLKNKHFPNRSEMIRHFIKVGIDKTANKRPIEVPKESECENDEE